MRIIVPILMFFFTWLLGYNVSYVVGDHLEDNLNYIEKYEHGKKQSNDKTFTHALNLGEDPKDIKEIGSSGFAVWRSRRRE